MWEQQRGEGGGSLENLHPRQCLESTRGGGGKNVRHVLKLKLVAILSSARRETVTMVTAGQTGGLDCPERLRRVPLTPALHSFSGRFDTQTLPGPGSSSLTEIHLPASQTKK